MPESMPDQLQTRISSPAARPPRLRVGCSEPRRLGRARAILPPHPRLGPRRRPRPAARHRIQPGPRRALTPGVAAGLGAIAAGNRTRTPHYRGIGPRRPPAGDQTPQAAERAIDAAARRRSIQCTRARTRIRRRPARAGGNPPRIHPRPGQPAGAGWPGPTRIRWRQAAGLACGDGPARAAGLVCDDGPARAAGLVCRDGPAWDGATSASELSTAPLLMISRESEPIAQTESNGTRGALVLARRVCGGRIALNLTGWAGRCSPS